MTQPAVSTRYAVPYLVPEMRNESWHQNDQGDWAVAAFDIDLPSRISAKLEGARELTGFERDELRKLREQALSVGR